ncbi:hypothetical protein EDB81DRAFT_886327 [Dactylonectria macrodidyma]|uniref:BZIP transcription factor n=1 Tax=Dactylonectria macrodidyma TaxID=307937 RepID=A0A9P9EEL1_9HYPO|nr:hypothetical protein EDB81DRAFT_886327 [Dactylonectria macrodidyma]
MSLAKSVRTRSPGQLQRKRALDKASQKRKRERAKVHIQDLEDQLDQAREEIAHLRAVIRNLEHSPDSAGQTRQAANTAQTAQTRSDNLHPAQSQPPHHGESSETRGPTNGRPAGDTKGDVGRDLGTALLSSLMPADRMEPSAIECCCIPMTHKSYSECFEHTVFTALVKSQLRLTSTPPIPVNPELSDLLLLRSPTNPVTAVLYKLIKRPDTGDLALQTAVYLLAYRILRYRFFPSLQAYNDIPESLRPTDIQTSVPHPLHVDFMPFPLLRDAMALGKITIDGFREQLDADWGRHISLNWPSSESLLVKDLGETALNHKFEGHVCTYENWSLDETFAKKYPDMAPLVTIRHSDNTE